MKINFTEVQKKVFKQTGLTTLLVLVIIAAYFEINVLISKTNFKSIDVTAKHVYSITDETKEKLKDIPKEVKIQLVNFENYSTTSTYADVENIIDQYKNINNINIEKIIDEDIAKYTIIVTYNNNQEELSINDLYGYKFLTDTYYYESLDLCEEKITNTILDLINNSENNVYCYITHSAYNSAYIDTISNNYNNIKFITLEDDIKMIEHCKCLIIPAIIEDISENEKNVIINYINNGGNILLLQESKSLITEEMPNFTEIMNLYGVNITEGVVLESDSEKMIKNKPGYILADYNVGNDSGNICMIEPGVISFSDNETLERLKVKYNVIAKASDTAFLRTDMTVHDYSMTDSDSKLENAILGAEITKNISEDTVSKMIIYSNSIFATDQTITINDILTNETLKVPAISINDNEKAIVNSINYLINNDNRVFIRKNSLESIPTLKFIQSSICVQTIFVIPMIIIIIGYIVWRIRKSKK